MLGEFIFSEQSKTKANGFAMEVSIKRSKELATEVTSKILCRHVWLVTSVDVD
jgi:hypothetical protein